MASMPVTPLLSESPPTQRGRIKGHDRRSSPAKPLTYSDCAFRIDLLVSVVEDLFKSRFPWSIGIADVGARRECGVTILACPDTLAESSGIQWPFWSAVLSELWGYPGSTLTLRCTSNSKE